MLWDHVFRTFHLPRGEQAGTVVGIADAAVPESYLAHLATPFRLGHYEALAVAAPSPSLAAPASTHAQHA